MPVAHHRDGELTVPVTPLLAGDPERLGEHVLAGRLGSGGMGTVYLGRSPDGRRVAIKVVRPEQAADPRFLARFRSEVRRARQVPPFCTAAVLHDDLEHDPPYLVVEYVDGPSLAEVVRENGPLPPSEAYAVAVGVATALVAIHGAGVVHRDLKPANVLLAVGLPKVIDFGIARGTDLSAELTGPDHVVGTIGYLAPECLDTDRRGRVGPPADVFAWGVLVGFAATGRTPFGGESPLATIGRILTQPPDLDGVPEPLRRLAAAALEKDPARRPAANELLDALLSAGRPDMAPELRKVALAAQAGNRRTGRWLGRAAAVLVAGLLVAAGVALARSSDEVVRQDRALVQRDLLDRSAKALETDPGLALRLAVSAETVSPSDRGRAAIDAALATGYEGELNPDEAAYTTEFRPDGAMVAAAGAGDVGLWSVQGARFTRVGALATAGQETTDLSFSPDGRTIATAGARLQLWDTAGAYPVAELTGQAWDGVQFSGDRLLTVADRIELWDVRDRARPRSVWSAPAGTATRGGARLSADGQLLAGVAEGELLTVWAADGTPRRISVITDADAVINLAFSPDGRRLAAATVSDGVRLYDLADPARPRLLSTFAADGGTPTTVAFDRSGTLLAVGSEERTVGLWSVAEPASPQPLRTLRRDGGWISSIDFSPDGHRLLTAGWQGAARAAAVWRVAPFAPVQRSRIDADPDPIRLVGVSGADVLAVAALGGGRIEFWDLRDPSRPVAARPGFRASSGASRVRPSAGLLYASGSVYDLSGNDPRRMLDGVVDADPDRGLAAVLRDGERVLIYKVAAGAEPIPLAEIPAAYVAAVVFDQVTGRLVIADDNGGAESALTVWDLADPVAPRRAATLAAQGGVQALEARAGTVVTVDRNVVTWTAGTVRSAPRPGNRVAGVGAVTLSADGALLAITGRSGTELWSLPPGADPLLVAVLPGQPTSAAFSPRGPLLAVGDPGGTTVWDVSALQMTLRDPHSEACLRQGGLTEGEWAGHVPTLRYEPACS